MPRGGRRAGAGRKPKTFAELDLTGGFRVTRHAHLLKPVSTTPAVWTPTEADLAGMGEAGRAFVARILDVYEPTLTEALQVLEAARAADVLAELRAEAAPDRRQLRLWSAYYTATIRMLGLTK